MAITPFKSEQIFEKATAAAPENHKNNTDVIAPEFKLYIEGVQVPFESISITQIYGGKPSADIQIPPQSGLLDILRGYEPKVHIFYRDDNYGGDRLLFWGVIKSSNYSRSRSQGSTYITFRCEHKNTILESLTLDFTGWASPVSPSKTDPNLAQAVAKAPGFNSTEMVIQALAGTNGIAYNSNRLIAENKAPEEGKIDLLDADLILSQDRLQGMPGVLINLWNQVKRGAYLKKKTNLSLVKMYIPLIEEGISYFKRMSGHPCLESKLQASKEPYCNRATDSETKILVPPYYRSSMISAVQRETAVRNITNIVGFSGELTSFDRLTRAFLFDSCKYDVITLASPAEIYFDPATFVDKVQENGVQKTTIETIVKPQIPSYFSPTCNVLLPRMYSSIMIQQDEGNIPTRMVASHDAMPTQPGPDALDTSYKAPPSFREAVAYNAYLTNPQNAGVLDLKATLGNSFSIPSKYEQGVGIRPEKIALPWWLTILATDKAAKGAVQNQEKKPEKGTPEYNEMIFMSAEWKSRYGVDVKEEDGSVKVTNNLLKHKLNPYDPLNDSVLPHERIMYSTIDYEYSVRVSASKNGNIEALFNPYIIPGYPMDVIDDSPNHPSFHGFCTSVTHTITSRSVSTSIGMTNVVTYAELSNFYMPPASPYLQSALELVNGEIDSVTYGNKPAGDTSSVKSTSSVLIQNPKAKAVADKFYREVLGVGSAAPDDLIHFASNRAFPLERKAGVLLPKALPGDQTLPDAKRHTRQDREQDDYFSSVGNLRLVSRPIESKDSISSKFKYNFIDLNPLMYNQSFVNYLNPKLASNFFLEPGASLFLDYMEVEEFINI